MDSFESASPLLVPHPEFCGPCKALRKYLLQAVPGRVIFLVGVSGSGKTWVRHTVARELYGQPENWPPGRVPFVEIMSLLGDRGFFSPKDLAVSLFEQIHVPKIDWLYKEPEADRSPFLRMEREIEVLEETWRKERLPRTEWETWRANISSGSHRMTQVVSIEHASLMVQNRVNGSAVQHTLNLMSAATGMGSSIILTTTPEGCGLWSTYAEINRRSRHVFINPYDLNEPSGRRNFAFLVKSLSKGLKFEPKHLPLQLLAAIGEATQTAIDGVSRILYGARDEALARGSEVISRKDLQQSFPSPFEVMNLRKSAQRLKEIQTRYTHPTFKDCDGVET